MVHATAATLCSKNRDGRIGSLVVGNYCHDVLFRDGRAVGQTLGGAASFVSNVLDSLSPSPSSYIAKVGSDFSYSLPHPPLVSPSSPTTLFHAYFSSSLNAYHGDRVLSRVRACDPIYPSDLPDPPPSPTTTTTSISMFDIGLAVGIAGEITPGTLERLINLCKVVFVDAQGLIRSFDPSDGTVSLVPLRSTEFYHLLPRIAFLKASSEEAPFVDIDEVRNWCCVLVTEGKDGCRIYWKDGEARVSPFPTEQVDPTGAGDSFFGGFVAGLLWGLTVPEAALLGNLLGSITVSQVGVPKFDQKMLQNLKQVLEQRTAGHSGLLGRNGALLGFHKSDQHDEFHLSLQEAISFKCNQLSAIHDNCS